MATPPGLEPGQTVPKTVVLPLHHGVIIAEKCQNRNAEEHASSEIRNPNAIMKKQKSGSKSSLLQSLRVYAIDRSILFGFVISFFI